MNIKLPKFDPEKSGRFANNFDNTYWDTAGLMGGTLLELWQSTAGAVYVISMYIPPDFKHLLITQLMPCYSQSIRTGTQLPFYVTKPWIMH